MTQYIKYKALLIGFLVVGLTSCGSRDESASIQKGRSQKSSSVVGAVRSVGVAYALGGKGDLSYNDAASKGVLSLHGRGIDVREFEPTTLRDYEKGLDLLSSEKLQVIFCVGFLYDEVATRIAKGHESTLYVVLDGGAKAKPNVSSIKFNAREGSFLAGVVGATISKKNILAFVGGADIPVINEFLDGYRQGAKWVNASVDVRPFYVGTGGAAFTDPVKGREVGLSAISVGADVIFHAAGSSGNGVIKAAREANITAIGVDVDQRHLAPDTVATSMMKNFDVAMEYVIDKLESGSSIGGRAISLGLAEGAVSLAPIKGESKGKVGDALVRARAFLLKGHEGKQ